MAAIGQLGTLGINATTGATVVDPPGAERAARDRLAATEKPAWLAFGVTRTNKHNDRDHQGLADGTADAEQHLPRYFAKSGFVDVDPKKTKKDGGGKGNWGTPGDEALDGSYNLSKPRRRSNSSVASSKDFKTKFETIDPEPVFEEEIHGARRLTEEEEGVGAELEKQSTSDSSIGSVEEGVEGGKM